MSALEEQVKTVLKSNNELLDRFIKASKTMEPQKPELIAEIVQPSLQPALEVKEEISKMSRQLSRIALI